MTKCYFVQIKRCIKLNNSHVIPKKGMPGYDPTVKYDLHYTVILLNVKAINQEGRLDICGLGDLELPYLYLSLRF